jgi:pimeloyl-ACP methyl ester carboxylesterase
MWQFVQLKRVRFPTENSTHSQGQMHFMFVIIRSALPALLGAFVTVSGANADIFKKEDLLRGVTITRAQCDATAQTLWLNVDGRDFCVRYYLSTAGGEGTRPAVILQGDQLGKFNLKTWKWTDTSEAKDVDTNDIVKLTDLFSKMTRTTAIYLARLGVDGTSGTHLARGSQLELDVANTALDALKQRYGFEGFHLAGQSGGSKLAAALVWRRHDIGCVVLGSGRYDAFAVTGSKDPAHNLFDTTEHVAQVAQNRAARLYVVSDKADKRVPLSHQSAFVDKLRHAGRQVPQFFVEATDDLRHGVLLYTQLVAAGCILDRPDDEIGRALATVTKRSAEHNEQRRREISAKAAILAAARQSPAGAAVEAASKK